jgi:hypothetical protein
MDQDPWLVLTPPARLRERVEVLVELLGDAAVAAVERVPQVRTPVCVCVCVCVCVWVCVSV